MKKQCCKNCSFSTHDNDIGYLCQNKNNVPDDGIVYIQPFVDNDDFCQYFEESK